MRVGHLVDEGWTSVGCGLDIWGGQRWASGFEG